ncbi:hypothetical protein ABE073_17135 [Lederbergia citrisecunda]|uniref:hypothetical protein n=1 Tax=Lederbergia citrisecunda TaxID=2833583 RepID=UPI003D2677A9
MSYAYEQDLFHLDFSSIAYRMIFLYIDNSSYLATLFLANDPPIVGRIPIELQQAFE